MTARTALAAMALAIGVVAACGGDDDDTAPTTAAPVVTAATPATSEPGNSTATSVAAATDVTVDISDFAFVDADVTVPVGGSITWTNRDEQQHTATGAGAFDTGPIQPGESATVTFEAVGELPYVCSFHPFMKGTVTVR